MERASGCVTITGEGEKAEERGYTRSSDVTVPERSTVGSIAAKSVSAALSISRMYRCALWQMRSTSSGFPSYLLRGIMVKE